MSAPPVPPLSAEKTSPADPQRLTLAMPIDVRSTSLVLLTLMASIVFLEWAQAVLIPITFAVLLSYALTPVVNWLRRIAKVPKAVGAALTLSLIVGALGVGLISLQPEALNILDLVPRATQKFNLALRGNPTSPPGAVSKIQKAASEIEKAANSAASPASPAVGTGTRAAPEATPFRIRDYVLKGTAGLAAGIGQFVMVLALAYFLLVAGDTFRRTLVRISGDTLSRKKITVEILDEIDSQIQRYLMVQIATSALLGVVAWPVFAWIGLEHAATWACIGAVLHLIPYVGPTAFVAVVALVSYVQFDTLQPVVAIVGSMVGSIGVIAMLVVPWLTQKMGSLNAVTVFVALLVWGWLWGIWGLLLGVPIVMAVKAACERIEDLQVISAFLGHGPPTVATDTSPALGVDTKLLVRRSKAAAKTFSR
jgi:predicted PurR-regulated permease PerM